MRNLIKDLREEHGLSMAELGRLAGTTAQQINFLEKGKRGLDTKWLKRITDGLNKKVGYEKYKPWHLIADRDDLEFLIQNEEEKQLIETRRALEESKQGAFDHMTADIAKSLNQLMESKKND